ncbi:hypothetical protein RHGRI_019851 [Rhododendron griersonianum]|uniref:Uncharacterized protein n=1 Tax=Rhododendron griersonianum TaxID=479676 RepID=A0AAV6JLN4_9ERIC|nr:hypothetical protein RHGRI_019851 [Rhododendron griersonianum]
MGRTRLCRSRTRRSSQRRWTTSELFRRRRWLLVRLSLSPLSSSLSVCENDRNS